MRNHRSTGPPAHRGRAAGAVLLALAFCTPVAAGRQVEADTVRTLSRSPRGALIRSALVPGWGQVYNGQPLKAPVVVGAIGGLIYVVVTLDADYRLYREAYQFRAWQDRVDRGEITENPSAAYEGSYDEVTAVLGPVQAGYLRSHRDALRRNRDFSILGIGLVWALSVLDAYVSAQLLDFDVGEELSLGVRPGVTATGEVSVAPSLVWRPGRR